MSSKARCSFVLLFCVLALVSSNAAESPAELYWKSKLGSITMPKVLKASLLLGLNDGMVQLNPEFNRGYDLDKIYVAWEEYGHKPNLKTPNGLGYPLDKKYGTYEEKAHNPYSVSQDGQVIWFTNENLTTVGTKMKLLFNQIDNGAKFLPSHITKSITNAPNKLQAILKILSLDPKSISAKYIKQMFRDCGAKGTKDEVKYCATSLHDMVDFVTNLRKDKSYMVVSTEQERYVLMEYMIQRAQKIGTDDKDKLVCHRLVNPYTVFLCHTQKKTDVYNVSLVGSDKKQMDAIAACHKDTSEWNPKHSAFRILNVKQGANLYVIFSVEIQ